MVDNIFKGIFWIFYETKEIELRRDLLCLPNVLSLEFWPITFLAAEFEESNTGSVDSGVDTLSRIEGIIPIDLQFCAFLAN